MTTLDDYRKLWKAIPEGADKQRQRRFIEHNTEDHIHKGHAAVYVFNFSMTHHLGTGRRFMSVGCGFPMDTKGITANEARSLLDLKPLKPPILTGIFAAKGSYTARSPSVRAPPKPVRRKEPPVPVRKTKPEQKTPDPKPFKLGGTSLLKKKVKPVKKTMRKL